MQVAKDFGRNVRRYRKMKGMQQKELERKIEVKVHTIADIEDGFKFPNDLVIERICKALNVECTKLFEAPKKEKIQVDWSVGRR